MAGLSCANAISIHGIQQLAGSDMMQVCTLFGIISCLHSVAANIRFFKKLHCFSGNNSITFIRELLFPASVFHQIGFDESIQVSIHHTGDV